MSDQAPTQADGWMAILTGRLGLYTLILNLGTAVFAINQFVVSTIMPSVVADVGGLRYYAWSFALFAVGAILGSASAGPVRAAVGDRVAFTGSALAMAFGLLGAALADDMLVLAGWRFFQGVGGGAIASQCYGLVAVMYPERLRGRALGLVSTMWGVATLLGPGFGGIFAEWQWWRGAFWALLPMALIVAALAWAYVPQMDSHGKLSRIPYIRMAFLGGSVLVLSMAAQFDLLWIRLALILLSLVLAAIAFRRDAMAEHRMFPREVTRIATEVGAANWMLLMFSVVSAFVNVYSAYALQTLHGVSPLVAGYLNAIPSFCWTFTAIAVAPLRTRRQTAAIVVGDVLIVVGAVGFAVTVVSGPVWLITVFMSVLGFGIGAMNNPTIQRVMQAVPDEERHVAGTATQSMRTLGIAFGAAISGVIGVAAGMTTDTVAVEVVGHAMSWVYWVNVGWAVLTLLCVVPFLRGYDRRIATTPNSGAPPAPR